MWLCHHLLWNPLDFNPPQGWPCPKLAPGQRREGKLECQNQVQSWLLSPTWMPPPFVAQQASERMPANVHWVGSDNVGDCSPRPHSPVRRELGTPPPPQPRPVALQGLLPGKL